MTRAMVRTLVGARLKDPKPYDVAIPQQEPPQYTKWDVRLYFEPTSNPDDDSLAAIIVHRIIDRPMQSIDWP